MNSCCRRLELYFFFLRQLFDLPNIYAISRLKPKLFYAFDGEMAEK
jgi:hypothetical protein